MSEINDNKIFLYDLYKQILERSENEDFKKLKKFELNHKVLEWQGLDYQSAYSPTNKIKADKLFEEILAYCFHFWKINGYISSATKKGNTAYLQEEDYFQEYTLVLLNTMRTYSPTIGNFENYFIKSIFCHFMQILKCSYLYITGNISPEKRKDMASVDIDAFHKNLGISSDFCEQVMAENVHTCLHKILTPEEYNMIMYKYCINNGKKSSDKSCAKAFNMSERSFYDKKHKIMNKIRKNYPNLLDDFMDRKDDVLIDEITSRLEKNN